MREGYLDQVSLLLDVLPIVAEAKVFALKGGTAINFFVLDCPRLSVDIDLHYLPLSERDDALLDIRDNMESIKSGIEGAFSGVRVTIDPRTSNAVVQNEHAVIKIEPNSVIRGPLLPAVEMALCPTLEQEFNRVISINCLAVEELYAGKLCAALQRQHPRDLFDTWLFMEEGEGLTRKALDVFLIYLISQGKPISEMLAPNVHDVEHLYHNHFVGMAKREVSLERLREIQTSLPSIILSALTNRDRAFLVSFKRGKPGWNLLSLPEAQTLPGVRWKQLNLDKMDAGKRTKAMQKLAQVLSDTPYLEADKQGAVMPDETETPEPQEQLVEEIVAELIGGNLIDEGRGRRLQQQLTAGSLKPEDWSLLIDTATKQDGRLDPEGSDD